MPGRVKKRGRGDDGAWAKADTVIPEAERTKWARLTRSHRMTKRRYPTLKKLRGGSGIPRESEPPRRDRTWRSPGGSIS